MHCGFGCIVDGWRVVERWVDDKKRRQNGLAGELLRGFGAAQVEHFVEYRLRVHDDSESWTIHRRFEEFRQLNLEILQIPRSADSRPLATFPRRTLWSSMDPQFLDARMLTLADYVADLRQDQVIGSSAILESFLMPDVGLQNKRSIISSDTIKDGSIISVMSFFLTMEEQGGHDGASTVCWHETRDSGSVSMSSASTTAVELGHPGMESSDLTFTVNVADSSCSAIWPQSAIVEAASSCPSAIMNDSFVTKTPVSCHDIQSQASFDNSPSNSYLGALLRRMRAIVA